MKVKNIRVSDIVPGMKAYGDVYNDLGLLIYRSGYILKKESIAKLALYSIKYINVEIPEEVVKQKKEISDEEVYAEKIRQKAEFKKFVKEYEEKEVETKSKINDVLKGVEVSRRKLLDITTDVTGSIKTNSDLFDFLNNMPLDADTYTHSLNVSILARTFARWVGLAQNAVDDIGIAAILHDVGKMKIPKEILNKKGQLTSEEYEEIKKHPIYSYRLAQEQSVNDDILKGILMHHERYNGEGYPTKAKGDKIHLYAKIIAIADVFEAMTSARSYRTALCQFKVLDMIEKEGFTSFDPKIIGVILENIANSYVGNTVKLSDGRKGEIIFINRNVARPIIDIGGKMLDLSKDEGTGLYIESVM